jgi:hypothetical protein
MSTSFLAKTVMSSERPNTFQQAGRTKALSGLALLWVLASLLVHAVPSMAQGGGALEPREAQFVLVIDDSGSMSQEQYGRTDPDRLAVLAVRALLGVLDDRDWVSVIRLNGPRDGEEPPPLAPLDERHLRRLEQVLDLEGKLAAYAGDVTPCRSALEDARELLNGADRPNVSQVVIFLTDGECTPRGDEERVLGFLDGLRSHQGDRRRFQLYLLRFQGTTPSGGLQELAELTGGTVSELRRGDPTRILHTFAQALSRSQGYESQILTASNSELPAHQGARRVRLLAVVPGGGPAPLEIRLSDRQGNPLPMTTIDRGVHHYLPDGREYRFVSGEYRPAGEPVRVDVRGAGNDWDVVALPEYRLGVEMVLRRGRCGEAQERVESNTLAAGSDLCAVIRLVNDRAQAVGQDVTEGRLEGVLEIGSSGRGEPERVTATPLRAGEARFELDLQALAEGYHTLRAAVHLTPPGESRPRTLRAQERTLQAVSRAIEAEPAEVSFGDVYPGSEITRMLRLKGRFSETDAHLELANAGEIPPCVSLSFAGKPLGETVRTVSQQAYPLILRVAAECAVKKVDPVKTHLSLRMPELPGGEAIAIPLSWRLDSTVREGDVLLFELAAGESAPGEVVAPSDVEAADHEASLEPPGEIVAPSDVEAADHEASLEPPTAAGSDEPASHLRVGFSVAHGDEPMLLGADGEPVPEKHVVFGPANPVGVWVEARPCCDTGSYYSRLRLRPVDGGPARVVPIEVRVTGDWWTCYRSWVIAGLLGLLATLLSFYVLSMFAHTNFLAKKQLVARLIPLRWPRYGGAPQPASDRGGDRGEVEDMIRAGLPWHQRVLNWLRANPLVFGLPGRRFYETAELLLASDLGLSSVVLVPERDVVGRLQKAQELDPWEEGRLFARAGSAVSFLAVRGPKKEVGQLTPDGWYGKTDGLRVEPMNKGQRLIHKIPAQDRREGFVAGWVLE